MIAVQTVALEEMTEYRIGRYAVYIVLSFIVILLFAYGLKCLINRDADEVIFTVYLVIGGLIVIVTALYLVTLTVAIVGWSVSPELQATAEELTWG